jgi:hypothetical protein
MRLMSDHAGEDVRAMQKMFIEGKEAPPIAHNLPPIAGALTWCRGLLERIKTPMAKIRKLDKSVMESEEARDVIKDYTAFQGQLSDYEREQIEAWGAEVEKSSQAKLKNPLLRSEVDVEFGYPLLYVNFDPLLVRLLREVKYFLLLGFEAPQAALEIYEHAETFRRHMGNLDLVVNVYNWMQSEMLPVERPLLSKQLELLDDVLAQGIAPHKVSTQSSSFTSIRGRSRSERGVSLYTRSRVSLGGRGRVWAENMAAVPRSRDAVARGVAMTCRRGDGVPADASPGPDAVDATLHTNHGPRGPDSCGDPYLTGRRPHRTYWKMLYPTSKRRRRRRRRRSPRRSPSTGRATTSTCTSTSR